MKMNVILALSFLFASCNINKGLDNNGNIPIINLDFDKISGFQFDSLFTNPRFVQLENIPNKYIESFDDIKLNGDTIYILSRLMNQKAIFAFNLQGDFLFEIDAKGYGPGEYPDIHDFYINSESETIGVLGNSKIFEYNFRGEYTGNTYDLSPQAIFGIHYQNDHYHTISFRDLYEPRKSDINVFAKFDSSWNLIFQDISVIRPIVEFNSGKNPYFPYDTQGVYFSFFANEYIYEVCENYLKPIYLLDFGNYTLPETKKSEFLRLGGYNNVIYDYFNKNNKVRFGIDRFYITEKYILLKVPVANYIRYVLYDREKHKTCFLESITTYGNLYPQNIYLMENRLFGIIEASYIQILQEQMKLRKIESKSQFSPDNFKYFNSNQVIILLLYSLTMRTNIQIIVCNYLSLPAPVYR
jgi:hypothetical protein